jgi:hypothetical protein
VIRLAAGEPTEVVVSSGGHPVHTLEVPASPWFEGTITLPEEVVEAETEVRLEVTSTERPFAALHYWAYQPES